MQPCLINQSACGRVQGVPVCSKCGLDDRVMYPSQADREAAQTAAQARYWETHARELEQQVKRAEETKASVPPPPVMPSQSSSPTIAETSNQTSLSQPAKSDGFNWAWVPVVVVLLGVGVYFKFQKVQDQRRVEDYGRALAQMNSPTTEERILSGAAAQVREAALATSETASDTKASPEPNVPQMVRIPAGSFMMGSPENEPERLSNEGPQRLVQIATFDLSKYEVTFAQWDACVADGGCSYQPKDKGWGRGNRPVINVGWNDITQQYILWLNRKTGKKYRLPSEAEWEYAARAGCVTPFNFGSQCSNKIEPTQANFDGNNTYRGSSKGRFLGRTAEVGSYPANGFGLHDMYGNVWEWVQDCNSPNYSNAPSDGRAWMSPDCEHRVLRGGSWYLSPQELRAAVRFREGPGSRINGGFRLARALP
jgi:formylglycine-generating enzyme required for sulfatase activity